MRNLLLSSMTCFISFLAHGEWIEDSRTIDVDSSDAHVMAISLTQFPETLDLLSAENLTAPSRVRITHLRARLAQYHWQNDESCSVADPGSVGERTIRDAHVDFFYESHPEQSFAFDVVVGAAPPCHPLQVEPIVTRRQK